MTDNLQEKLYTLITLLLLFAECYIKTVTDCHFSFFSLYVTKLQFFNCFYTNIWIYEYRQNKIFTNSGKELMHLPRFLL